MSPRNRRSPGGPATDIQIPILGAAEIIASSTAYLSLGELGAVTDEVDGQYMIPQDGSLSSLVIQNVVAGTVSGSVTYNVRKNGVLITRPAVVSPPIPAVPASGTLLNTSQEPLVIQIGVGVKGPAASDPDATPPLLVTVGDLISVRAVSTAFGGTSPVIRATLLYSPGGPF